MADVPRCLVIWTKIIYQNVSPSFGCIVVRSKSSSLYFIIVVTIYYAPGKSDLHDNKLYVI